MGNYGTCPKCDKPLKKYTYSWYNKETGKWEKHTGAKCTGFFCDFKTGG